jgi:hypothetical protein
MEIVTRQYKVFEFKELSEQAQEKALEKLQAWNVDGEWWENTYGDAEMIGLKITSFDIDRDSYVKGEFTESEVDVAQSILDSHGEMCETYKTAKKFLDGIEALKEEFRKSLLEDYRIILQKEYEYLTSREAVEEMCEANEYRFTEDGKIFNK